MAFAVADVADVALDDGVVVFLVDVADEFDGDAAAGVISEGEVFVADVAVAHGVFHGAFTGLGVGKDADFPEFLADEMFFGEAEEVEDEGIDVFDFGGCGVEDEDAVVSGFEEPAVAVFGGVEDLFEFSAFGDVVEDHDDAGDVAGFIAGGCGAVVDMEFGFVFGDEDGVVGEADDGAIADGPGDGAFDGEPGFLIDDVEDVGEKFSGGVGDGPAGHFPRRCS